MLSHYDKPEDILKEFWADLERATYWHNRQSGGDKGRYRRFQEMVRGIYCGAMRKRSEMVFYDSPKTGNRWMLWDGVSMGHDGLNPPESYRVCYRMLERYMCLMIPTKLVSDDKVRNGVTIYTPHMFQRMHERLGVDMTDRMTVIRNFCENLVNVMMDRREPRGNEKHDQIVCRLPGSWIRGHYIPIGSNEYVIIYRTYYTDKTLTPYQRRELKSFRKIADQLKSQGEFERYVNEKKLETSKNDK